MHIQLLFTAFEMTQFCMSRCFDSDGEYAVGGTTNGQIFFWRLHVPPGEEVVYEIPRAHQTIICSLVVSSDGLTIITSAIDGSVRVWELKPSTKPRRKYASRTILEREIRKQQHEDLHRYRAPIFHFNSHFTAQLEEAQRCLEC